MSVEMTPGVLHCTYTLSHSYFETGLIVTGIKQLPIPLEICHVSKTLQAVIVCPSFFPFQWSGFHPLPGKPTLSVTRRYRTIPNAHCRQIQSVCTSHYMQCMLLVNISHFTQCDTPDHCGLPTVTSHSVTHQTTVVSRVQWDRISEESSFHL